MTISELGIPNMLYLKFTMELHNDDVYHSHNATKAMFSIK